MPTPSDPTAAEQDVLYDLLDHALSRIEDGLSVDVEVLLAGHEELRERAVEMIRLASRVSFGSNRALPIVPGYHVIGEIGRGGMGAVYLARQEHLGGRPVALKVLPPGYGLSQRARRRFTGEALAIAKLRHPNIVAIYDVIDDGDAPAYSMEWVDGWSLAHRIRETLSGGKQPDIGLVCRLGISTARALAAVHCVGLVHRDVKPSNILIRGDGTPLLSDFGLVRETDSTITQAGQFAGTVAYASPEQLRGDHGEVDARSDVYSLGMTLFHALALRLPYEASEPGPMLREIERGPRTTLRRACPRAPRDLETIIAKTMDADPARRYQSADELADDLERLLSFQPIRARRAGVPTLLVKLVRRHRAAAVGIIIGSVISLAFAAALGVYVFLVPNWVAAHVAEARLALLDPEHGNQIYHVLFFDDPLHFQQVNQPDSLRAALAAYDRALFWKWFNPLIRRERDVVQLSLDILTHSGGGGIWQNGDPTAGNGYATFALAGEIQIHPPEDSRSLGLFSLLTGNVSGTLEAWTKLDIGRERDPFLDAALGILHLANDEPARAYPRLHDACRAFPNVGFLTTYLADAALQCGDVELAGRLLDRAGAMPRQDAFGGIARVRADWCVRQGAVDRAEQLYRDEAAENPIAQFQYANLLAERGDLDKALKRYQFVLKVAPQGRRPLAALGSVRE